MIWTGCLSSSLVQPPDFAIAQLFHDSKRMWVCSLFLDCPTFVISGPSDNFSVSCHLVQCCCQGKIDYLGAMCTCYTRCAQWWYREKACAMGAHEGGEDAGSGKKRGEWQYGSPLVTRCGIENESRKGRGTVLL